MKTTPMASSLNDSRAQLCAPGASLVGAEGRGNLFGPPSFHRSQAGRTHPQPRNVGGGLARRPRLSFLPGPSACPARARFRAARLRATFSGRRRSRSPARWTSSQAMVDGLVNGPGRGQPGAVALAAAGVRRGTPERPLRAPLARNGPERTLPEPLPPDRSCCAGKTWPGASERRWPREGFTRAEPPRAHA